ncbi:MAG: 1-deoxy-D-xylulose-5-phosphate synthase [Opitutales bacterium]|nr:1-deoxy-D-xylulose-5-phosphate synthase [Opitutales bacterium]NRA27683.1 1-deoxy-D-xylulose-5-phosphate synthase [Opitutales bacterium]
MSYLENTQSPEDVKALPADALPNLAEEIRARLISVTAENGGHIGPNLGVVELTIALHRQFSTPKDRFVFDVSHQGYVHKLLTGRNNEAFDKIRTTGGLSGFLNRAESEHDCYGAGHAGTALSAALGMATARDLKGTDEHVVAVCGDAAFTCGITMEALNNVADSTKRLIVILNDNEWSIDKNVGAIAKYFNELITNPIYKRLHDDVGSILQKVPGGDSVINFGKKWKHETKDFFVSSSLFEKFGLRYIGPIDGHDLPNLEKYLEVSKQSDRPIILHVITEKGKGCHPALQQPEKFHGASPFDPSTGKSVGGSGSPKPPKYQDVFGKALLDFAKQDARIAGITGAMPSGTGLNFLRDELPKQYFDVGIAEEHAVLFAAGLATQGLRPVCAIYSTFLQRAYDPIIHDICLQNLPVLFCMDRAGVSPQDGATHHGLYDISYLRCVPNTVIMQPADEDELVDMMATGLAHDGPAFIRYPRGNAEGVSIKEEPKPMKIGVAEPRKTGTDIIIWALGNMVSVAENVAAEIESEWDLSVGVINARFAKPLDAPLLEKNSKQSQLIVTVEDHVRTGGFGSAIIETLQQLDIQHPVECIGWPDAFVDHGSDVGALRDQVGLDSVSIKKTILKRIRQITTISQRPAEAVSA